MTKKNILAMALTLAVFALSVTSQAAEVWQNRFRSQAPNSDIKKLKQGVTEVNKAIGIENSGLALVGYQSVPRVKQVGKVELIQLISEHYEGPTTPDQNSIEITEIKELKSQASDAILIKLFEGMKSTPYSEKAKAFLTSAFKGALSNPLIGLFEFSHTSEWGHCQGAFFILKTQGYVAELVHCRKK